MFASTRINRSDGFHGRGFRTSTHSTTWTALDSFGWIQHLERDQSVTLKVVAMDIHEHFLIDEHCFVESRVAGLQ